MLYFQNRKALPEPLPSVWMRKFSQGAKSFIHQNEKIVRDISAGPMENEWVLREEGRESGIISPLEGRRSVHWQILMDDARKDATGRGGDEVFTCVNSRWPPGRVQHCLLDPQRYIHSYLSATMIQWIPEGCGRTALNHAVSALTYAPFYNPLPTSCQESSIGDNVSYWRVKVFPVWIKLLWPTKTVALHVCIVLCGINHC